MRTVYCTATKSWVTCTPEIEAVMRREGESPNAPNRSAVIFGGTRTGPGQATDTDTKAIVDAFKASFREQFEAGLVAAREERTDRLRAALSSTPDERELIEKSEALSAERKKTNPSFSMLSAARELVASAENPEAWRDHIEGRSPAPKAGLSESERAELVASPAFALEAEKRSLASGINVLDAAREILRDRDLDARIGVAKGGPR